MARRALVPYTLAADASSAMQPTTKQQMDAGLATKAATSHTHAISNTTGLQTALDGKLNAVNTATITVSSSAPSSPATGDLWVDTT